MSTYHAPVLLPEIVSYLDPKPGKRYIDATLGGGSYLGEIVRRGGVVLGIDLDREAITHVRKEWTVDNGQLREGQDFVLVQGNFRSIEDLAAEHGFHGVDGIVFDLGVSGHQFDTPERGFSIRFPESPLDMRLDPSEGTSARDVLRRITEEELYEIITRFGEEKRARTISHALVRGRSVKRIETVGDLRNIIDKVTPAGERMDTYVRVFQALRIYINDELTALREGMIGATNILRPGGILAVVSFHSLEDRIVKQHFLTKGFNVITKKPIVADEKEIVLNRRARSAKLRVAEKL